MARRSLGEVRAAVTSYRQPSLAGELAAARQMLAAAGMDCQVHAPASIDLAQEAEGLLAWTVREGVTNVVRHSGARTVTITVTVADGAVTAEVADDGVGPGLEASPSDDPGRSGSVTPGSGLAGLAERARAAGAEISTGEGPGGQGIPSPGPGAGRPGQRGLTSSSWSHELAHHDRRRPDHGAAGPGRAARA